MKDKKYYTVKQWKKFKENKVKKNNTLQNQDIQEIMCKKYDIILTDYKTKRQQVISILKNINLKNIDKGISTFNKILQEFGGSMGQLTKDINETSHAKPSSRVQIWSDSPKIYSQIKDKENLERIWGKK
jgi:hypothetical protein